MKENSLLVIIAAAGSGERFGGDTPKQYMQLNGKSVIENSVYPFLVSKYVKKVIIAISKNDEFIEYEEVYGGNYYGTLKSEVNRIWKDKKIAIFDIDVVGGANIKGMFPNETLSIFVMPPSIDILHRRLIERGDVSKQEIDVRIKKAESELDYASKFDNIIINNDLEESKKIALTLIKEFIDE